LFLILAFVAAFIAASIAYRSLHEQMIVDTCLSGKHGSFDYSKMACAFLYVWLKVRRDNARLANK
jgi:hypothetical protein